MSVQSTDSPAVATPTRDLAGGSNLLPSSVPIVSAPDTGTLSTPVIHPHALTDGRNRGKTVNVPATATRKAHTRRPRTPKPPKESKIYKMAVASMALRYQGVKWTEISEQLGVAQSALEQYIKIARKRGWLADVQFVDPDDAIEYTIKDRVVNNLRTVLDERTEDGALTSRAVDVTVEAAKGVGMFKQHQAMKVDSTQQIGVALKVQVIDAPQQAPIQIREGSIGGTPAIEAEIVGDSSK